MEKAVATLTLIILLFSCETRKSSSERIKIDSSKDDSEDVIQNHLKFGTAIEIDSLSDYVMYPFEISQEVESDLGASYGRSSYDRKNHYWNIIFYNTKTEEYHCI